MGRYQSGLEIDDKEFSVLTDALSAGFNACGADDWDRFQEYELQGWMNAVPSDEFIAEAQEALGR